MMMSNLSMVEARLPPGFRFHPKDEELVCDYLSNKVSSCHHLHNHPLLLEIDLNNCEPWDLPEMACVGGKEWYFYSQRDRKYATGLRTNRATVSGYWKATGKDISVIRKRTLVGMRKTLVFYLGRAPKGKKTDWVMHEFRLQDSLAPPKASSPKEDWVLCRVFCKNRDQLVGGKHGKNPIMGNSYEESSSSPSLPPLMDPPNYTSTYTTPGLFSNINQPTNINNNMQQVPCFSIFTSPPVDHHHHININPPDLLSTTVAATNMGTATTTPPPKFDQLPMNLLIPSSSSSSSYSCEKEEAIKAVLTHFNNMDHHNKLFTHSPLRFGTEGISDQSFLSDEDLAATMWYP